MRTTSKRNSRFAARAAVAALTLFALMPCGRVARAAPKSNTPPNLIIDESPLAHDVKVATSFAPVVKKVAPSVVNIYSKVVIHGGGAQESLNVPFLWHRPRDFSEQNLGSGVVVSPDGYILTANHLVEGAESVTVSLASGEKEFDARIVGTDKPTDVAVLKIDTKRDLPAITMADSDKLEVGDVVLAVGNPFTVGQTVTLGIISGLSRRGLGINAYENFIQTDAAINPGNSGGALVDAEGRLVGINTAIVTESGGYQGVGFAVPVNMARFVMDRLIEYGRVSRGFLGVDIQTLSPKLARAIGLPDDSAGVLVTSVSADSAADKAGLKYGDVILEFDGQKVTDRSRLQLIVAQTAPQARATLRILRPEDDGKNVEKTLMAVLSERPQQPGDGNGQIPPKRHTPAGKDSLDGVEVTDLDARIRRELDVPGQIHGALVTNVDPESNSAQAGLHRGDIILEIERHPVRGADDAVALSEKAKGDHVLLRVWTPNEEGEAGSTRYLAVDNTLHK